jgi:hypothetical protein
MNNSEDPDKRIPNDHIPAYSEMQGYLKLERERVGIVKTTYRIR